MESNEDYLGDGVYVTFDGYALVLDLRAQNESRIVLEPQVLEELIRFAQRMEFPCPLTTSK